MKKMMFCLFLMLAAAGVPAYANHGGGHGGYHKGSQCQKPCCQQGGGMQMPDLHHKFFMKVDFLMQHREALGLDDEQVKSIEGRMFEIKRILMQSHAAGEQALLDIYEELHTDQPNVDKMKTAVDTKIEAKRAKLNALVDGLLAIRNALTAEQRAKAKEIYWNEKYANHECPAKPHGQEKKG